MTVVPNLDADHIDSIRLDVPFNGSGREQLIAIHFLTAMIGDERSLALFPGIKVATENGTVFNEIIETWRLRVFYERENLVF